MTLTASVEHTDAYEFKGPQFSISSYPRRATDLPLSG
jgi:hypothetical protein